MDKKQYPFLSKRDELQKAKDLDVLQEQMISIFSAYGLTFDEAAALLFSTMKIVASQKKNKEMLRTKFNIDVEKLDVQGILVVQRALVENYLKTKVTK